MSDDPQAARPNGRSADDLDHLIAAARDALSDDIVGRLAAAGSDGLDLLDRLNRSGAADALPMLAAMAKNGDLERLAQLARLLASAQDALSDDIVSRLAGLLSESLALLDRLTRDDTLNNLTQALSEARREMAAQPRSQGGWGNLLKLLSKPEAQEGLQYMALLAKHLRR